MNDFRRRQCLSVDAWGDVAKGRLVDKKPLRKALVSCPKKVRQFLGSGKLGRTPLPGPGHWFKVLNIAPHLLLSSETIIQHSSFSTSLPFTSIHSTFAKLPIRVFIVFLYVRTHDSYLSGHLRTTNPFSLLDDLIYLFESEEPPRGPPYT